MSGVNYLLIWIAILLSSATVQGQTLREWIQQKKTQKRYLLQQILANESLLFALRKGYQVSQNGLRGLWWDWEQETGWHRLFFDRLKYISPDMLEYARLGELIAGYLQAMRQARIQVSTLTSSAGFQPSEIRWVHEVYAALQTHGERLLLEMIALLIDKELELAPEERMGRAAALREKIKIWSGDFQEFTNEIKSIRLLREFKRQELRTWEHWYGLKSNHHEQ